MPNSYTFYKNEVKEYFKYHVPKDKKILDVGPGQGTYAKLLADIGYEIDAIEAWPPYVDQFKLTDLYRYVYIGDIRDFNYSKYDYIILGDILEHLTAEEGQKLIKDITSKGIQCLVAIPYMMEQDGEEYGNIYETHLQADLTPEVMAIRYPELIELYSNNLYGYYTNYEVKFDRVYVLYANESYIPVVKSCVESIKQFSNLPVYVYLLNTYEDIPGANVITWNCPLPKIPINTYINRSDKDVYRLLIERPAIVKDALLNYAHSVAYIDSDTVATKHIDKIFDMYPKMNYPYFVEGIYDYLHINGRGGADTREDMSTTLEAPACELFGVNQYIRQRYRQTGYFVANHYCFDFLDEWYWMCKHPKVLENHEWYAPYHEETIVNVLLWKWNVLDGLPYIYTNASIDRLGYIYNNRQYEWGEHHGDWFRLPENESHLLFLHGEKNPAIMHQMIKFLSKPIPMKILFLAPHLSTGGMPQFLLQRIYALRRFTDAEIHVVEYAYYGDAYVVQRNAIKNMIGVKFSSHFDTKVEIADYIKIMQPDIIHIDEMSERLDREMVKAIYDPNRKYRIVETCHDVSFKPDEEKVFHPDLYAFCSPYHEDTFANMESKFVTIEYPIENKRPNDLERLQARLKLQFEGINVINVGLWTKGKNQAEGIEIARKYPEITFHFIGNQASNFADYWEPLMKELPANVKVWGERQDVETFLTAADIFMFNSTWECNPLALREAISYRLPIIARNLPQYKDMFTAYLKPIDTDLRTIAVDYEQRADSLKKFAMDHYEAYEKILKEKPQNKAISIIQHFINNPFLEIKGQSDSNFRVVFFDDKGICHYDNTIKSNHWVKLNRQWFTKWRACVYENGKLIYDHTLDLTNKRVYISIDSKSLGDTIAWVHYCKVFKDKHKCEVVVSTFWNNLLHYPELEFVTPGIPVNCYAMYIIGWHYDENREPELCNTIPLQKAATNILGLEFTEERPLLDYTPIEFESQDKIVTIATNSTSGCKFWTKEGWQEVINYLTYQGYTVYNVSKEKNPFDNCVQIEDTSMENTINMISISEFFIGLSSGLSWLAWALNVKVFMISNFTEADHEFTDCVRITNTNVCHGCWNEKGIKFDRGDWNWCKHKGTDKHFECHTSITGQMVIEKIKAAI